MVTRDSYSTAAPAAEPSQSRQHSDRTPTTGPWRRHDRHGGWEIDAGHRPHSCAGQRLADHPGHTGRDADHRPTGICSPPAACFTGGPLPVADRAVVARPAGQHRRPGTPAGASAVPHPARPAAAARHRARHLGRALPQPFRADLAASTSCGSVTALSLTRPLARDRQPDRTGHAALAPELGHPAPSDPPSRLPPGMGPAAALLGQDQRLALICHMHDDQTTATNRVSTCCCPAAAPLNPVTRIVAGAPAPPRHPQPSTVVRGEHRCTAGVSGQCHAAGREVDVRQPVPRGI